MERRVFLGTAIAAAGLSDGNPFEENGLGKVLLIDQSAAPNSVTVYGTEGTLHAANSEWILHGKDGAVRRGAYFCNAKLPTSIASIPEE